MTEYVAAPLDTFELDGKLAGTIDVRWNGDQRVYVHSDAISYRDSHYRVSLHMFRNEDGTLVLHEMHDNHSPVRRDMSPAPRTYTAKIIGAIVDVLDENWSDEQDELGTDARISRDLTIAQRKLDEAHAEYREARAEVRKLSKRQRCEHCGERHLAKTTWCGARVADVNAR